MQDEGVCGALKWKRERRGRWALSVEVKGLASPSSRIYRSTEPRSPIRTLRALTAGEWRPSLTKRAHHDRSGQAHARVRSLRRGNRRAAAGRHVRPPTSPTTRVAAAPEKARPRRITVAATVGIKWLGPLPSKDDPRASRARGSENPTLEGCDYRPVVSKPTQRGPAPQVPSIHEEY
jgi:hypothetical protein